MDDCVGVTGRRGRRKFVDTGWALRETRFSVLIHELVHLYNPLDAASTTAEVYDIQPCADLDKKRSVGNAENWALYAACKLYSSLSSFSHLLSLCLLLFPFGFWTRCCFF